MRGDSNSILEMLAEISKPLLRKALRAQIMNGLWFSLSKEYSDVHFNFRYQRQKGELREGSSD
jgi:hypothetical protein